ncbi:uncharacterized protein LOC126837967 [Adelges cooleyi]|uniref:uncharacterized protein LOC126837967 n=1 Tax=Adelges cooleyi TaxID=133065 RepID=UPI00217F362D|nr:uncharacterized protein LOC126837967 [Adelges cooleyi]
MITIKIILLLYLAAYVVACSGSDKSAKKDDSTVLCTDADDNGLGEPSNPLNEDKSINEDSDDEVYYDTVTTLNNTGFEGVQDENTGGEQNMQVQGLGGSGLPSSRPKKKNVPKLNKRGTDTGGVHNSNNTGLGGSGLPSPSSNENNVPGLNNRGAPGSSIVTISSFTLFGHSYHKIGDTSLFLQGGKLRINGKIVEGLNARKRPIRLEWGDGELKVDGETHDEFKGIEGTGICNII